MYSYRSDFIRIIIGWHSGSPILALNSSTYVLPLSSTIMPAYRKPLNGVPRFFILFITGSITCLTILLWRWLSNTGAGEYAPIPPVLGPLSPSNTRLWSLLDAKGIIPLPSQRAMTDASSPERRSSTTVLLPARPNHFLVDSLS